MHQTVLLREAVEALVTTPDGYYVDGTFGRGGHSRYLLQRLGDGGRVLGVDKDLAAQAVAQELALSEPRFEFFHGSFAQLPHQLRGMGIDAVDGILLDILFIQWHNIREILQNFYVMQLKYNVEVLKILCIIFVPNYQNTVLKLMDKNDRTTREKISG